MLTTLLVLVAAQAPRPLTPADALYVIPNVGGRIVRVRDADGDGCADLIAARGPHIEKVTAFEVLSGRNGATIRRLTSLEESPDYLSWDAGGDVDGDGVDDLVLALPDADDHCGIVRVISGADASVLRTISGTRTGERFGASIAFVGDVDNDDKDEFVVGSNGFDPQARRPSSKLWEALLEVGDRGSVSLRAGADGREIWSVEGAERAGFGAFVGLVGDLDGDGHGDIAVRSRRRTGAPLVLLSSAAGREIASRDLAGGRVLGTSDLDGDGVPELLHELANKSGGLVSVRVISGKSGVLLRDIPGPDPMPDARSLADVGDLDGDGVHDIAIGDVNFGFPKAAPGSPGLDVRSMTIEQASKLESEPNSVAEESGCVVVHSGRTGAVVFGVWAPREPREGLGYDVLRGPDVDGDGIDDLIVSDSTQAYAVRVPKFVGANAR